MYSPITLLLAAAAAGLVAAQTTTSTASTGPVSGCGTQIDIIIQTCLGTEKAQLANCSPNDWDCLCEQSKNVLTCYNNCPADPNRFGAEQTSVSYCNAAKAYPTHATTTIPISSSTSSSSASRTSPTTLANVVSTTTSGPAHTGAAPAVNAFVAPVGAVAAIIGALALF